MKNTDKHQTNLDYINKILQNKPVSTDRIKQMLEYNCNNIIGAKIILPDLEIPNIEFADELKNKQIILNNSEAILTNNKINQEIVDLLW